MPSLAHVRQTQQGECLCPEKQPQKHKSAKPSGEAIEEFLEPQELPWMPRSNRTRESRYGMTRDEESPITGIHSGGSGCGSSHTRLQVGSEICRAPRGLTYSSGQNTHTNREPWDSQPSLRRRSSREHSG